VKKLILGFALVIGMIGNAQNNGLTTQYQTLTTAEYGFLRNLRINYVCPLGRNTILNNKEYFKDFDLNSQKLLKSDFAKFKKENQTQFPIDPSKFDTIAMSFGFHDNYQFAFNVPIVGYFKYPVVDTQIEYVEIIEYKQLYPMLYGNTHLTYEFIILIKYFNDPWVIRYIPDASQDCCTPAY
jgi:hypothetical protein